jgi:myo-inositol-1(or 4)-monophosphatase
MEMELLATARQAAAAGAQVVREMWGRAGRVDHKARFDFVTDADRASEEAVTGVIAGRRPDDAVLAEESAGADQGGRDHPGVLWVVDPLDGTTNFIHGFPHVAVSVAALVDGRPAAGVVRDVTRGEEFSAARGRGAWLEGREMRVSACREAGEALVLTGFPFRAKERLEPYLALFAELFQQVAGMRRAGSAALDLAYVAAGRAEGFWEMGLSPWDLAAGLLLVSEAGGVATDFAGGEGALWQGDVVAACPALHGLIQEACARRLPQG